MTTSKTLTEAGVIAATSEIDLVAAIEKLRADVERMNLPENRRAAQRRFQQGVDRLEEATYESKTLKLEIGALLRGQVRMILARDTSLEVREVKGFLESVFVLTARNAKQYRELERVQAWIRRIQADGNE